MFDAPWPSCAIAVHTQESIPPLNRTTAFRESFIKSFVNSRAPEFLHSSLRNHCALSVSALSFFFFTRESNTLGRRVPDELVQLQTQPHRQAVTQNPFREHSRLEPRPLPLRIFEYRRK